MYNMEDGMSAAAGQKRPPPMHRPAAFEDRAKPVWVSLPFVAVAAVAVILLGHFVSYRKGRQLGREGKDKNSVKKRDSDALGTRESAKPLNLADLRRLRAEAAEARLKKGTAGKSDASAVKPTPLGMILAVARKVDQLEKEAADFLRDAEGRQEGKADKQKEQFRLLELLTQVQLEIDGIMVNETVRQHRRTQTTRVQNLISVLEGSI